MAFQYAASLPERCICRWKAVSTRYVVDRLDSEQVVALARSLGQSLSAFNELQARISTAAGCPVHEPQRPFPVEACRAKGCNTAIIWTRTDKGRWMPVEAEPSDDGNVVIMWSGSDVRARVLTVVQTRDRQLLQGRLHVSHFAACPEADRFRRPR
jgi:hypothetical protein